MIFGVTIGTKGPQLSETAITDMKDLGLTHLRFQVPWHLIESSKGNYNWSLWDDAVEKCHQAGIHLCLTIKQPPSFWKTADGFPRPEGTSKIAQAMAARYKSKLKILHIANEDFDNSAEIHFDKLAAVMRAVYDPVKQINPNLEIWPGALLQRNLSKQKQKLEQLWEGAEGCFDAISVHPYTGLPNGADIDPANENQGNIPGFRRCIQQVKRVNASFGHEDCPIVVDEFNFAVTANFGRPAWQVVTEEQQWQYLKYCYDHGRELGVAALYVFTLGYASFPDGMSLVQGNRKTIAYHELKKYIAAQTSGEDPDGEEDPDPTPTGPTAEQIAQALARLVQAEGEIKQARVLLS